jgi:RimJ/RimL family protein N-acetyltransferase
MIRRGLSSGEREYATLVAQLRAVDDDVAAMRADAREAATSHLDFHHESRVVPRGERVTLANGATIVIRPIEPSDRDQLATEFQHLSALTRFRSVYEHTARLTRAQLDGLTGVDHFSAEALLAFDADTGALVGLGRYARHPHDSARAEFACTVTDAWHRRGVATALVERLAVKARAAGIEQFVSRTVVGDVPGRRLLAHIADHIVEHRDGGMVKLSARPKPS